MPYARNTRLLNLDALLCGAKSTESNRAWFTRVNIAVREYMNGEDYDASHDYEHCVRVVGIAHQLWVREKAETWAQEPDPLVVFTAALVHDIGDAKYPKSAESDQVAIPLKEQRERQHKIIRDFLNESKCPSYIAEAAAEIASSVSFSREIEDPGHVQGVVGRLPALRIVQDADRLDALGEMGIARAALYGGINNKRKNNTILTLVELIENRFAHYPGLMKTETGKIEAELAWDYMVKFKNGMKKQANYEPLLQDA